MRVNVFEYPDVVSAENGDQPYLAGWFQLESSTRYQEATQWDGSNHVSVNPGGRYSHQELYHTAGGRWVLHTWSQWQGVQPRYSFVDEATAREWLILNEKDKAVEFHFGPLPEESGAVVQRGGRPAVGTKVESRIPRDVLLVLDQRAALEGATRAEMIRRLVFAGLGVEPAS